MRHNSRQLPHRFHWLDRVIFKPRSKLERRPSKNRLTTFSVAVRLCTMRLFMVGLQNRARWFGSRLNSEEVGSSQSALLLLLARILPSPCAFEIAFGVALAFALHFVDHWHHPRRGHLGLSLDAARVASDTCIQRGSQGTALSSSLMTILQKEVSKISWQPSALLPEMSWEARDANLTSAGVSCFRRQGGGVHLLVGCFAPRPF
eukprot:s3826_g4.t1